MYYRNLKLGYQIWKSSQIWILLLEIVVIIGAPSKIPFWLNPLLPIIHACSTGWWIIPWDPAYFKCDISSTLRQRVFSEFLFNLKYIGILDIKNSFHFHFLGATCSFLLFLVKANLIEMVVKVHINIKYDFSSLSGY